MTRTAMLPPRATDAHKGTFGHVLVVAGSRGMSGAAVLTGSAALRGGAGLVTVACPIDVQPQVAMGNPCFMTVGLPLSAAGSWDERSLEAVVDAAANADVLAIGPGLGRKPGTREFVSGLLDRCPELPAVVDADALNAQAPLTGRVTRTGPTILTPHPGEFARLTGSDTSAVQSQREAMARDAAKRWGVILVLKGHSTIVTDGEFVSVNDTGNPGMATGGSGDVLTGVIAALLAQELSPRDAAVLGVWVHGRAGDLAARELGQPGLIATDILAKIPHALMQRTGAGSP